METTYQKGYWEMEYVIYDKPIRMKKADVLREYALGGAFLYLCDDDSEELEILAHIKYMEGWPRLRYHRAIKLEPAFMQLSEWRLEVFHPIQKSDINIEVQGALKDSARKHFKGTIDFKKGCKKATGNENEACVLLSDTAKSLALPMLLCSEEDVEGNHSCSAGKIGEKELFYIMSRGFELKDAMKMMVRAKFNNILKNIKDEELKEQILNEIDERLD